MLTRDFRRDLLLAGFTGAGVSGLLLLLVGIGLNVALRLPTPALPDALPLSDELGQRLLLVGLALAGLGVAGGLPTRLWPQRARNAALLRTWPSPYQTSPRGVYRLFEQQPLAALGLVTALALFGLAAVFTVLLVAIMEEFIPNFALIAFISLALAGLVALGWRWSPLLGTLWGALLIAGNQEGGAYLIEQPEPLAAYAAAIVGLALALLAIIAGLGATIQNFSGGERHAPRWLPVLLAALVGLCLGAIAVAAFPRPASSAGASDNALGALPALTTIDHQFEGSIIHARAGQPMALRLQNADPAPHSFDIDEFDVHVPMPPGKTAVALFTPTAPGAYRFYCRLPGHELMRGTLIVTE